MKVMTEEREHNPTPAKRATAGGRLAGAWSLLRGQCALCSRCHRRLIIHPTHGQPLQQMYNRNAISVLPFPMFLQRDHRVASRLNTSKANSFVDSWPSPSAIYMQHTWARSYNSISCSHTTMVDSAPAPAAATAGSSEAKKGGRPELELELEVWQDQLRGWLATIAVLVAQSSLQSALSPPGRLAGRPERARRGEPDPGRPVRGAIPGALLPQHGGLRDVAGRGGHGDQEGCAEEHPPAGHALRVHGGGRAGDDGRVAAGTCRDMQSTVVVSVLMGLVFLQMVFMLRFANVVVVRAWKCLKDMYKCFGQKYEPPVSAPSGEQRA